MKKLKVVFLQKKNLLARMFMEKDLKQIEQWGEVIINDSDEEVTVDKVVSLIKDADIAVTSWSVPQLTEDILQHAPELKLVLHAAGSVKPIVSDALFERGIRVVSCNDPLAKGVAETALGLTISSLKDMWRLVEQSRQGGWGNLGRVKELYEIKIGVIGAGRAGSYYIEHLQHFDVEVLVYDPMKSAVDIAAMGARKVELDELLQASDLISIHAPAIPETDNMFNKRAFDLMKDDCIIVNTSRGGVINEAEFAEELAKGRFFACLDVTNPEPPAVDHPFRSLSNVILTSHIAGAVNNGLYRIGAYSVKEMNRFVANEKLHGEVRKEQLAGLA